MSSTDSSDSTNPILAGIQNFLRLESASGILLLIAAIFAMLVENSPASSLYDALLDTSVGLHVGAFAISKPLLLWINDGLMAVFFFLVGLELKREVVRGELSDPAKVTLPLIGAIGGMAIPAAIYVFINRGDQAALHGWAIPSATDIAFALGVLSLLGKRVPNTLKLFLLTLAIVDDMGAIVIIALFYTEQLSISSLIVAGGAVLVLFFLNRRNVVHYAPYFLFGLVLWAGVLKSGVHATLAGVVLAMFIPLKKTSESGTSPLEKLEQDLHPTVAFFILPVFAFANTGISFEGLGAESLLSPIPLGIAAGLFLGNQIGVFSFCWIAVKSGVARLPQGVSWMQLYGVAILCGIGFTMSLFISSLAFDSGGGAQMMVDDRLGILLGSVASAIAGYVVLHFALRKTDTQTTPV